MSCVPIPPWPPHPSNGAIRGQWGHPEGSSLENTVSQETTKEPPLGVAQKRGTRRDRVRREERQKVPEKPEPVMQLASPGFHRWLPHRILRFIFISSGALWPQWGCSLQGGPWDSEFSEREEQKVGDPGLMAALVWGPSRVWLLVLCQSPLFLMVLCTFAYSLICARPGNCPLGQ